MIRARRQEYIHRRNNNKNLWPQKYKNYHHRMVQFINDGGLCCMVHIDDDFFINVFLVRSNTSANLSQCLCTYESFVLTIVAVTLFQSQYNNLTPPFTGTFPPPSSRQS
ncbi:hypothetical protein DERF_014351 [Dermatophagoides farinae]|uniref:Uncharacterized protein n=1 Tax=Dermatophagoides farinae TaxID=6954 RepID=A0A922HM23_DERFA|nr:hypothetical protein DERF_014351 [Dermatophagoides farinae]